MCACQIADLHHATLWNAPLGSDCTVSLLVLSRCRTPKQTEVDLEDRLQESHIGTLVQPNLMLPIDPTPAYLQLFRIKTSLSTWD
jgi:hypothetical protein